MEYVFKLHVFHSFLARFFHSDSAIRYCNIYISIMSMCGVENTLSKSKLVTLLKWDVEVDTLVQQRFYPTLTGNFGRNPTKQTGENGMLNSDINRQKSGQILIVPKKSREHKCCCLSVASLGHCGMCGGQYCLVRNFEPWWPSD